MRLDRDEYGAKELSGTGIGWDFCFLMDGSKPALATVVSLLSLAVGALSAAPAALADSCPNAAARQGASVSLPDCRAYEQVTPVDKGDSTDPFSTMQAKSGEFLGESGDKGYSSEDGNRFLLGTFSASFANGVSGGNTYVFSRGAGGWTTTAVAPPSGLRAQSLAPVVYDSDFSEVGVTDRFGPRFFGSNVQLASLIGPLGGPYTTIDSEPYSVTEHPTEMVGASEHLSHVVLESRNHQLAPGDAAQDGESSALYEWVGGQLHLVNVASNGSLVSRCGATTGVFLPGGTHNTVSSDGSKIFFTAPDPTGLGSGCWNSGTSPQTNPPQLYMRVNGTTTVELSAPDSGVNDPNGLQPAFYVGASADGSRVFFMTQTELTADDTAHAPELYEYNTQTSTLTRVSRGDSGTAEGNVDFVPAISSDGSAVYFTAFGQLAPGVPPLDARQVYLYRYDTRAETTTYITKVGSEEYPLTNNEFAGGSKWYLRIFKGEEPGRDARANWHTTADGRYLVFASKQEITGYNSKTAPGGSCTLVGSASNCTEVYRYGATDNSIVCVSCGPPGVSQVDNALFARSPLGVTSDVSPTNLAGVPPRPVSEDGSYVFFDTANALVPQATNGAVHVYEWHNGTISLISSVGDPGNAFFLGSSADGHNVFFGTHAQLAPQDTDVSGDLYDARVDGGFAGVAPPACTGTGCQGVPAAPPIFATPASVTFEGVGNFATTSGTSVKPKTKGLTRGRRLGQALRVCRRDRNKRKRAPCEAHARAQYGHPAHKSNRRGK